MGLPILALGFFSAPPAIVVDGNVTDWVRVTAGYHERQIETPIRSISVTGDGERVFVHFEFVKPQGLLALPGTLTLVADSDNNPNTGTLKEGLAGADIALEFSPNTCAVIVFTQAGPTEVKCGDPNLGLTLAPSFAATDAELAISRFGTVGTRSDLFSAGRVRWKMLFRDKAGLVREGQFVSRLPDARRHPAMTGKGDPLQRASGTDLRVATWNVANRSWNQHPEPYRRILRGLQPDIVLLVEVLDRSTETWIRSFFDSLGAQSGAWQFVESKTGGWDRCLVASRLPLTGAFDEVRHTSQTIQRLGPVMDKPVANPAAPHKTMEDGITSTAAYIEIGGRIVLTTAVHVACCDNLAGSPADQRREAEASAIAEKARDAMHSHPVQAVLTAGDLNLVSTRRALDLLREHLDVTGGDLSGEAALRLNGWTTATYVPTPRTPFPSSKLDYLVYSSSSLQLRRAFVFDSGELAPEWLTHYGISASDSTASDHLPVVADFAWRK